MKHSNRWASIALSLLLALLGTWSVIAAAGLQPAAPLAAPLSAVKMAAPAAQAEEDEPPLVGYPCGDGAQMPYWTICLHGDLVNAAGAPAGRPGLPVTVEFSGQTITNYTRIRPGRPGAGYAIDISQLDPDYMGEVTLTVGELGPFKVIVAPDLRTQNLRFDVPVDGAPAGRAAEDPVVVWGYVVDFVAREPLAEVPVTITTVDAAGEHSAHTVTTQSDNLPWPVYTFTQEQLDDGGVVLADDVAYTVTTSYNGDRVKRDRTWPAGEDAVQVNLFTNWMCDTPGEGGGRARLPKPPESGVAPRLKPDGLPETTGADGLPDMGCFWGYVDGTNGEAKNVTVRLEVAGQVKEETTFEFELERGDDRPRYGIIVQGLADIQGQPLTVTAVLDGATAVYTGMVGLDAGHSQRIDLHLDVNQEEGTLEGPGGTNSIVPLGNFVYVETDNGLTRFDSAGDEQRVAGGPWAAPVSEVTLDKDNCLWLISEGRVYRYCPLTEETETWHEFDKEETGADVTAIAAGADGAVWFGNAAGELHVYRKGGQPEWAAIAVTGLSHIRDLSVSAMGVLWVAAGPVLGRYDPMAETGWYSVSSANGEAFLDVAAEGQGAWVIRGDLETFGSGLLHAAFTPSTGIVLIDHISQIKAICEEFHRYWALEVDKAANVWVGCSDKVLRRDAATETWTSVIDELVDTDELGDAYYSIAFDAAQQSVWVGSWNALAQYDLETGDFQRGFNLANFMPPFSGALNSLAADSDSLFVIHHNADFIDGLTQYDLDALEFVAAPKGGFIGAGEPLALAQDRTDNSLWIAIAGQGVSHYIPGATVPWVNYSVSGDPTTGLMSDQVYAIGTYQGEVWFATSAGISVLTLSTGQWGAFDGSGFYLHQETDPFLLENVSEDMVIDVHGNVWLSGDGGLRVYSQQHGWKNCLGVPVSAIDYNLVDENVWLLQKYVEPGPFFDWASPTAVDARFGRYYLRALQVDPATGQCGPASAVINIYVGGETALTTDLNGDIWVSTSCSNMPCTDDDSETTDLTPGYYTYDPVAKEWQVQGVVYASERKWLDSNLQRDKIILRRGVNSRLTILDVAPKQADLDLALSAPTEWTTGTLTYALVITNTGLRPATDTTLTLDLPPGFTFKSVICDPAGEAWCQPTATAPPTWVLGELAPEEVIALEIKATGQAPVDTTLEAAATVATTADEAYTDNNTAGPALILVLDQRPDARVSLVGPTELTPGTTVTFTLRADNAGGSPVIGDVELKLGSYLSTAVTRWPGVVLAASTDPNQPAPAWEQTIQVTVAADAPPNTRLSPRAGITTNVEEKDLRNNDSVITIPTTLADVRTLLVVATAQLEAVYGAGAVLDDVYRLAGHDAVRGVVLDVSTDTAVAAAYAKWNAAHANAAADANALANATAEAISRRVLAELSANPQIQYVVIVGGDHVIPFFRRADYNPTQWQESVYADAFLPTNTTVYEALGANTFLTDDCYTDFQRTPVTAPGWFGEDLCAPDLATGRLVETPEEIRAAVDAFIAIGGEVTLGPAIVGSTTGDNDGDNQANDEAGLTLDLDDNQCQLLRQAGLVARCRQSNRRFRQGLLDTRFTTAIAAQHSSHYGVGLLRSSDVLDSDVSYVGMLLATIGCHAGLSVPPREVDSAAVDHDMPQAILGRGGTMIAPTTYGYGTKQGMGYSESFSRLLSQELLKAEPGQIVEVGPAMVRAKQAYIARHWGDAGAVGGFTHLDEKVVLPITLYGLPMLRVRLPDTAGQGQQGLVPPAPAGVHLTGSTIISTVHVVDPSLYEEHVLDDGRRYDDYASQLFERVGLPLQPARDVVLRVAIDGRTARGALLRTATFTTLSPFTPFRAEAWALSAEGQPVAQQAPPQPAYIPLVTYQSPVSPWDHTLPFRFAYFDYGQPSAYLFTVLGAYNEVTGEERRYDSLVVDIVYGDGDDTTPPVIAQSDSAAAYGQLWLLAQVSDPSGISQVIGVCEYAAEGRWESVVLTWNETRWVGQCPTAAGVTRTLLQVVDGAGNVTIGDWQEPPTTTLAGPDLVVESVVATPDGAVIVIRNVGNMAVPAGVDLWADLYINPNPPPAAAGDIWGDGRSAFGAAWEIDLPIPPGGTLTLRTDDDSPHPVHTTLPDALPLGAKVYVQIDSWNDATQYGFVDEIHEMVSAPYNNIVGPIVVQSGELPAGGPSAPPVENPERRSPSGRPQPEVTR